MSMLGGTVVFSEYARITDELFQDVRFTAANHVSILGCHLIGCDIGALTAEQIRMCILQDCTSDGRPVTGLFGVDNTVRFGAEWWAPPKTVPPPWRPRHRR